MIAGSNMSGFPARMLFMKVLLLIPLCGLIARAVNLQITDSLFLRQQSAARSARLQQIETLRGSIYDRNGLLLSASVPTALLWVDPQEINAADDATLRELTRWIDLSFDQIKGKIAAKQASAYVILQRNVEPRSVEQIQRYIMPGVHFSEEPMRVYPPLAAAFSFLGTVNSKGTGLGGVELMLDKTLSGTTVTRRWIMNRLGQPADMLSQTGNPAPVRNETITVDTRLQILGHFAVRQLLQDTQGVQAHLILIDSATGQLLAAVQESADSEPAPSFDVTPFVARTFEPGLTLAPFTIATALEHDALEADTPLPPIAPALAAIVDTESNSKSLRVSQVLAQPSRAGVATAAMYVKQTDLMNVFDSIGLAHDSSLGIPVESPGGVLSPTTWRANEQALLSVGRRIRVTLPQLARAYGALAMNGNVRRLSLIRGNTDIAPRSAFSPQTARQVVAMLGNDVARSPDRSGALQPVIVSDANETTVLRLGVTQRRRQAVVAGISRQGGNRIVGAMLLETPATDNRRVESLARATLAVILKDANAMSEKHMTLDKIIPEETN